MKNKEWILSHLRQANEQLDKTIRNIDSDPEYESAAFFIEMQHLYNHLNTAWNSRDVDSSTIDSMTEDDFHKWRGFPTDIEM